LKEAIIQLNTGIGLLAEVQDGTARMELELDLQSALGRAYAAVKGNAAPEVGSAFSRAHELYLKTGKTAELEPVVKGLASFHSTRGNPSAGKALVSQLLEDPGTTSDYELLWMHGHMGFLLEALGERSEAEVHFAITRRLWNHQRQLSGSFSVYEAFHARNLICLGHVDTALAVARDAVALARRTANSLSITTVLANATVIPIYLRDPAGAASFAEELLGRAKDHGFVTWERRAKNFLAWASALQAGARAGVSEIREGIVEVRSIDEVNRLPFNFSLLSEAELATGDPSAAAEAANEGLHCCGSMHVHDGAPAARSRLLSTRGDAMMVLDERTKAEADYHRALMWSRERNEKWFELNAALRLARLWQADGRASDACYLLARFTEGFDNPVLQDARTLLEELTGTSDATAISNPLRAV
jgi:tetratricopeptide (TPR) repeat protein